MKILIVKLGALGDVLRTTPLLTALNKKYPGAKVSWLIDASCRDVVEGNPLIQHLISFSPENVGALCKETFDLAVNLDKEPEALEAITAVSAAKKMGFGRGIDGKLCALDNLSDYAYRLGMDDELKFRINKKSYQQISFEQLGLVFKNEEYLLPLGTGAASFAHDYLKSLGVDLERHTSPIVGINTGAGDRFAGKKMPLEATAQLADFFCEILGATVLLLGGPKEMERNTQIQALCKNPVIHAGSHTIKRFAAIVRECDLIVTGDTTAMHIAIAVKTPVVAYFASTCASEIELYGRGRKIVSSIECAPCYKKVCPIDEKCMKEIGSREIFEAAKELLN